MIESTTEALTQGVTLPLWLHWLTLAYSAKKMADLGRSFMTGDSESENDDTGGGWPR